MLPSGGTDMQGELEEKKLDLVNAFKGEKFWPNEKKGGGRAYISVKV